MPRVTKAVAQRIRRRGHNEAGLEDNNLKLAGFFLSTVFGTLAGLVGGYVPASVVLNMFMPWSPDGSTIVLFTTAGAIVAIIQRSSSHGGLPGWWPVASAAGWTALITLASVALGSENGVHVALALPASFLFSLVVGGALFLNRQNASLPAQTDVRAPRTAGRFSGFRMGAVAVPLYLFFVGVGHILLAQIMSSQATGPRDGQAFIGTFVLGLMFVVLALFALPVALGRENGVPALLRGALVGLVVAAAVVAYTASRGYLLGGVTGGTPCIAITGPSGPVCAPPGGPTYIADAQPDVFVMLLASIGAYALAHLAARLRERRAISLTRGVSRPA